MNTNKKTTSIYSLSLYSFIIMLTINLINADNNNKTIIDIENLNMQMKAIKDKIHNEFNEIASAYANFHEDVFDLFNKVIQLDLNSEEVKESYIKVVKDNYKLLMLNKGFEHEFFNGKISKKIAESFFDGLITLYNSWVKSNDVLITSEEKVIYQSMIDNYNLIIKENREMNKDGKGFRKYKIIFKREIIESVIGEFPIIKVEGTEVIEDKNEL